MTDVYRFGEQRKISLDLLDDNPIQPPLRASDKALKTLEAEITQSHHIQPITVCPNASGGRFTKADGHRRSRIAEKLGLKDVMCIVLPKGSDPRVEFIRLNKATRRISGPEWMQCWAQASNHASILREFPRKIAQEIKQLISYVGVGEVKTLAELNMAPSIARAVEKVLSLQLTYLPAEKNLLTGAQVLRWLIEHRGQNDVTRYITHKIASGSNATNNARRLLQAIRLNKPAPSEHLRIVKGRRKDDTTAVAGRMPYE